MSLFVKSTADGFLLTNMGYILLVALLLGVLYIASYSKKDKERAKMDTKQLVFCAVIIALGTITSMIKVYQFPFGGAVTLCSMLVVSLSGYFYGLKTGLLTGFAYGVLQLIIDPYILFPIQVLVDYILAFGALGLSGVFSNSKNGLIKGYLLGVFGRYIFTFISGWIFFGEYAWEGFSAITYSLVYNGIYIGAEMIITLIIISIPAVSKGIERIKNNTLN